MNIGDGLRFELENGKPKLIFVNREEKNEQNQAKPRPRLPSVQNVRPPSRLDTYTPRLLEPIRKHNTLKVKNQQNKPGRGRIKIVTTSKTHANLESRKELRPIVKGAKLQNVYPNRKIEEAEKKAERKVQLSNQKTALQDSDASLTHQQLQQILTVVKTNNDCSPNVDIIQATAVCDAESSETKKSEEKKTETAPENALNKDKRCGGLLSWVEERPSEDKAALEAKKAEWKKQLDEQIALKQKINLSAPGRLQGEDDTESLISVHSSISYKDLPAAIRSSLKVGEFAPIDLAELTLEQKHEQRKQWLKELDKQREETSKRKRLEKLQQQETEDQHLWASHFDSLQRPLVAPPLGPLPPLCRSTDRGETSSSLSHWEETSIRSSVETSCGGGGGGGGPSSRASHLRTMTSLLDPSEIEERERRRIKQLQLQQAIDLQVEERRLHKEEEETRKKREEEEEEKRIEQEREKLRRQYERETHRENSKELICESQITNGIEPGQQTNRTNQDESSEKVESTAVNQLKDTGVQTEEVHISESMVSDTSAQSGGPSVIDRAQVLQMLQMLHKGFGPDPYEPFGRTERAKNEKRPDWNTQRPIRQFVPASQRYPEELQRQRQESRLRRQAQLLSLQRNPIVTTATNVATTNTTVSTPSTTVTNTTTTKAMETNTTVACPTATNSMTTSNTITTTANNQIKYQQTVSFRGRSPIHSESPAPDFLPYVRTDEVFHLKPLDTQQASHHTASDPQFQQKTQQQQEIMRGLAQLRQGLRQKQQEFESDLSCNRLDCDLRPVSTTAASSRHRCEL